LLFFFEKNSMKQKVLKIFNILNKGGISYLLLRPLDFKFGFNDVDIIVSKNTIPSMIQVLKSEGFIPLINRTNSNESLKMYVNEIVFDIQHFICFLPYKSLIIKEKIPYAQVREENEVLYPDVKDEVLFTFWTFRFLLDKNEISRTNSFLSYLNRYMLNWNELIVSDFFLIWSHYIFGESQSNIINDSVSNLFSDKPTNYFFEPLRKLCLRNRIFLSSKIFFDQLKFKLLRRLGYYKSDIPILQENKVRVNFFPKKQNISLIYTKEFVGSNLFKNLYIQISPKNSIFFRVLLNRFIINIRSFFKKKLDTPKHDGKYLGILKSDKCILFEMKNNNPLFVWKKMNNSKWEKSDFLGYQLISEYTVHEFSQKHDLIKKALQTHWKAVNKDSSNVHGDLTHFNILHNANGELFFIDRKSDNHSKIYDFFYFYTYLTQCISRCSTLNKSGKKLIIDKLKFVIKDVCRYDSKNQFEKDFSNLNIPKVHGLNNLDSSKRDFITIFKNFD
tara:strand:- start:2066 stop:3571 length:1506 start_codon:yes stop_codon:yes gene_type:complete